jgi:hypothetical protein
VTGIPIGRQAEQCPAISSDPPRLIATMLIDAALRCGVVGISDGRAGSGHGRHSRRNSKPAAGRDHRRIIDSAIVMLTALLLRDRHARV